MDSRSSNFSVKWMRLGIVLFIGWAVLLLSIVAPAADRELTWTGCDITKKAFMDEIAKAYKQKTGVTIKITGSGATKGIRAVASGASDLGGTCRPWLLDSQGLKHPEEKDAELVHVAWDALVVIVHPENPINNISQENLQKIFTGEITSWKSLGGPDMRIALIERESKDSGVGHMFRRLVFGDPEYEFKTEAIHVSSSSPLEKLIEQTVIAVGVDGVSSARKSGVKILAIDNIAPTKENIATGRYPLFRPLFITINKQGAPVARQVIDFMLSPAGQAIIAAQGTVNLEEGKALKPLWLKKKNSLGFNGLPPEAAVLRP